jgi:hypothetical protein
MVVNLQSPDGSLPRDYISNYALTQVRDRLARLDGVGDVQLFGARDYAMRVWIDPAAPPQPDGGRDRRRPARAERAGVLRRAGPAAYAKGEAFQLGVETQGRLTEPQQFADIVIRTDAGPSGARARCGARGTGRAGLRHQHLSVEQAHRGDRGDAAPGSNALAAAGRSRPRWTRSPRVSPRAWNIR